MDEKTQSIFTTRNRWTYQEIEELWTLAGISMEEWAKEVGIGKSYLNHYRLGYEPIGAVNTRKINEWVLKKAEGYRDILTPSSPDVLQNNRDKPIDLEREVLDILRDTIPSDAASIHKNLAGIGTIQVRKRFTICPKCGHSEERKFELTGKGSIRNVLREIREWLMKGK